tara:strand:+ start:219 stop:506 length:288 start_codon:yes stop_codon:yes gene_type:complete
MLIEIKRLIIENSGYKTNISLKRMYVNTSNIVSISDYSGAENFLLRENSNLSNENFSIIKLNEGNSTEDIIACGTASQLYSSIDQNKSGKRLLNE